jgi:integrase/recombinase XerC
VSQITRYIEAPFAPVHAPPVAQNDLIALLLDDKRSACTKRAYAGDLADFFGASMADPAAEAKAREFCAGTVPEIALQLGRYKGRLRERGLSEATTNRRLAAVRSLLKFAHRLGFASTDGRGLVESERAVAYRDTRGVDVATLRKLLAAPLKRFGESQEEKPKEKKLNGEKSRASVNTGNHPYIYVCQSEIHTRAETQTNKHRVHLLRDLAILHLLIENALRREELCKLNVGDFDSTARSLWILGKGKGNQKERITLSTDTTLALCTYLDAAGHSGQMSSALFRNFDPRPELRGARLTADGLYKLIGEYGGFVGLKRLTPHQLRHSAITAALDATGGDVRKVQKLSRHAKVETLMRYDDNRADVQGEMSSLLSGLMSGKKKSRAH